MKSAQTLIPCITKDNDVILSLKDYIKEYHKEAEWQNYSFISIIGKPTPIKYKFISYVLNISPSSENQVQSSRLNIAQSLYGKDLVQDVNVQGFDFYLEKEYKTVLFSFLTSNELIFIIEQEDFKTINLHKLLTLIVMSYWATKEGGDKKKLTFVVDCTRDIVGYFDTKDKFTQNIHTQWNEIFKPPGMEEIKLDDIIVIEFANFTQNELQNYDAKNNLAELSLSFSNPRRQKLGTVPSLKGGSSSAKTRLIKSNTSSIYQGQFGAENESFSRSSSTLFKEKKEKKQVPFEFYQVFYEELWKDICNAMTLPDLYDINCTEKMHKILEVEFQKNKTEVYNQTLFQIIEIRERIEQESIILDFGLIGRRIYEQFLRSLFPERLTSLFEDNEAMEIEKNKLIDKIEFELYELKEIQVKKIKQDLISELTERLGQTKNKCRTEQEYKIKLLSYFEQVEKNLISEKQEILNELMIFIDSNKPKWTIEGHLSDIKNTMSNHKKEFLKKEINDFVNDVGFSTRNELKAAANLKAIEKEEMWDKLQNKFGSIMKEKEDILTRFLKGNTKMNRDLIEKKLIDFKASCFEDFISIIRGEITDLDTLLFKK